MINQEKQLVGTIDDILHEVSSVREVKLDKDKFEFLRAISKTRYSGLTKDSLVDYLNFLKNKEDKWFQEILEDGLAETFSFSTPKIKSKSWEGWFVSAKGRKIIKEITNKM
ncbi:hypothetical protein D3C81_665140 [compost metagenome]